MKALTCIVCPKGCRIECRPKDGAYIFSGNGCKKGVDYALAELTQPMRTLCTTVRCAIPGTPAIPVRTSKPIPKGRMMDLMRALSEVIIDKPLGIGAVIVPAICGLDCDILCTSNALLETERRN